MRTFISFFIFSFASFLTSIYAQNVGIGTSTPMDKLHVAGNARINGLAGVGVRLVSSDANGTLVNVAAGTNTQILTQTAGGPAWQPNNAWLTTGNAGTNGGTIAVAGTNFMGTTDAQNIDFRTNNIFRARISSLGEFFVGTFNTVLIGDLMNGVGNATFPWAINGYTNQNGAGVYGQVTGGTTSYAGVQGEYNGTAATGAGVRGLSSNTTAGTSFGAVHKGVEGIATTTGSYKFGVYGSGGASTRSGGVMGYDYGTAGGLGYYSSGSIDYSVYGFGGGYTIGAAGGRIAQGANQITMDTINTNIGLGIYGGVMGGWVKGMKYGMHLNGERTSLYVDGKTFTNEPIAQLVTKEDGSRMSTYVPSSTTADVYARGKSRMMNGKTYITFDENFKQIISDPQALTITVTPSGNSNGVYVASIDENGFWVNENNEGNSTVSLSWVAVGIRKGCEKMQISPEILEADFDQKMQDVMHNEYSEEAAGSLWWDGKEVRFDTPPAKILSEEWRKFARPTK